MTGCSLLIHSTLLAAVILIEFDNVNQLGGLS